MAAIHLLLQRAFEMKVPQMNVHLQRLLDGTALSARDRKIAELKLADNAAQLSDPVYGPYHADDRAGAVESLLEIDDPALRREKAYRLAIMSGVDGDHGMLRCMRQHGVSIAELDGPQGHAIGFAIEFVDSLREYFADGFDPSHSWHTSEDGPTDLLRRASAVGGNPDVIRYLLRLVPASAEAVVAACISGHARAAAELIRSDPGVVAGAAEGMPRRALACLCCSLKDLVATERDGRLEKEKQVLDLSAELHRFKTVEVPEMIACACSILSR